MRTKRVNEPGPLRTRLIEATLDADPQVRSAAIDALTDIPGEDSTNALRAALNDGVTSVRYEAVAVLAKRGSAPDTDALIEASRHPDRTIRTRAAAALGGRAESGVVPALLSALADHDALVRAAAVKALRPPAEPEVIAALCTACRDPEEDVRVAAVDALASRQEKEVASALMTASSDPSARVRAAAVRAINRSRWSEPIEPTVVETLRRACRDGNESVRIAAVKALASRQGTEATDVLIAALSDPEETVRVVAAGAIGEIDSPDVTRELLRSLNDSSLAVRSAVIDALAGRLSVDVTSALVRVLADVEREARTKVVNALRLRRDASAYKGLIRALSGGGSVQEMCRSITARGPREWSRWMSAPEAAALALAQNDDPVVESLLIESLEDDDEPWLRAQVVWVLGTKQGPGATRALVGVLADPRTSVSAAAHSVLSDRPEAEVVECLLSRLGDSDARVRQAIANEMAAHPRTLVGDGWEDDEPDPIVAALIERTRDEVPSVREGALRAISNRAGRAAQDALIAALQDPDRRVAKAAFHALLAVRTAEAETAMRGMCSRLIQATSLEERFYAMECIGQVLEASRRELLDGASVGKLLLQCLTEEQQTERSISISLRVAAETLIRAIPVAWVTFQVNDSLPRFPAPLSDLMCELLDRCGQPSVSPWLSATVQRGDDRSRGEALDALARAGDPSAVADIAGVIGSQTDPELDDKATVALKLMGPAAKTQIAQQMERRGASPALVAAAAEALGSSGSVTTPIAAQLLRLLSHPSNVVSSAAAMALRNAGDVIAPRLAAIGASGREEPRKFVQVLLTLMEGKPLPQSAELVRAWSREQSSEEAVEPKRADKQIEEQSVRREESAADSERPLPKMPFQEHLEELVSRLRLSLASFVFFGALGAIFYRPLLNWLARTAYVVPVESLLNSLPREPYLPQIVALSTVFWLGLPVLLLQLWRFVAPGLYQHERARVRPVLTTIIVIILGAPLIARVVTMLINLVLRSGRVAPPDMTTMIWYTNRLTVALPMALVWTVGARRIWHWLTLSKQAATVIQLAVGGHEPSEKKARPATATELALYAVVSTAIIALIPAYVAISFLFAAVIVLFGAISFVLWCAQSRRSLGRLLIALKALLPGSAVMTTTAIVSGLGTIACIFWWRRVGTWTLSVRALGIEFLPDTAGLPGRWWFVLTYLSWISLGTGCVVAIVLGLFAVALRVKPLKEVLPVAVVGVLLAAPLVLARALMPVSARLAGRFGVSVQAASELNTRLTLTVIFLAGAGLLILSLWRSLGSLPGKMVCSVGGGALLLAWMPMTIPGSAVLTWTLGQFLLLVVIVVWLAMRRSIRPSDAFKEFREASEDMARELRSESPTEPSVQDAYVMRNRGMVSLALGERAEAFQYLQTARAMLREVEREAELLLSTKPDIIFELLALLDRLGDLSFCLQDFNPAEEYYSKELELAEPDQRLDAATAAWTITRGCYRLSEIKRAKGQYGPALEFSRRALELERTRKGDVAGTDETNAPADLFSMNDQICRAATLTSQGSHTEAESLINGLSPPFFRAKGFALCARVASGAPQGDGVVARYRSLAIEAIKTCIEQGAMDGVSMEIDPDLIAIRDEPAFRKLVDGVRF